MSDEPTRNARDPKHDAGNREDVRVNELEAQVHDIEDRSLRALADLDNMRKRAAREMDQAREEERSRVAAEWLPIVDNLELALNHAIADPTDLISGVRAVRDQATSLLERLGFAPQGKVGEQFDPARHEAISVNADPDNEPGTVTRVVRQGYGHNGRQLRPASVVVAQQPEE